MMCGYATASSSDDVECRLLANAMRRYLGGRAIGTRVMYMVVERFKDGDPRPVYRRLRSQGRLASDGLHYRGSWIDRRLERCFQLMETEDRRLLEAWIARWSDLVDFEVIEVMTSDEASELIDSTPADG